MIENLDSRPKIDIMLCGYSDKKAKQLKEEEWEEAWSFHANITEQWSDACEEVKKLQAYGDWEVVLVKGDSEEEIRDGVTYIFKRKTKQRRDWENNKNIDNVVL